MLMKDILIRFAKIKRYDLFKYITNRLLHKYVAVLGLLFEIYVSSEIDLKL